MLPVPPQQTLLRLCNGSSVVALVKRVQGVFSFRDGDDKPRPDTIHGFDLIEVWDPDDFSKGPLLRLDVWQSQKGDDPFNTVSLLDQGKQVRVAGLVLCLLAPRGIHHVLCIWDLTHPDDPQVAFYARFLTPELTQLPDLGQPDAHGKLSDVKSWLNKTFSVSAVPDLEAITGIPPERTQYSQERLELVVEPLLALGASMTGEPQFWVRFGTSVVLAGDMEIHSPVPQVLIPLTAAPSRPCEWFQRQYPHTVAGEDTVLEPRWELSLEGPSLADMARFWNHAVAQPYLQASLQVQAGRPQSLMPRLPVVWPASEDPRDPDRYHRQMWKIHLRVTDLLRPAEWSPPQPVDEIGADSVGLPTSRPYFEPWWDDKATVRAAARYAEGLQLPGMLQRDGTPVGFGCAFVNRAECPGSGLEPEKFTHNRPFEFDAPFHFALWLLVSADGQQGTRIGSLDLDFGNPPPSPTGPIYPALLCVELSFRADERRNSPVPKIPTVNLQAYLPVTAVRTGSEDDLPGEEFVEVNLPSVRDAASSALTREIEARFLREPPVVVPLARPQHGVLRAPWLSPGQQAVGMDLGGSSAGDYTLVALERTEPQRSQTLVFRLITVPGAPRVASIPVAVLDGQPFMAALVLAPTLGSQVVGDNIPEIGVWSSVAPQWQLVGSTDGYTLLFPPQTLGEAMEKGTLKDERADRRFDDIHEHETIDFRLSPPARFEVKASYQKQRLTEAVWNLRRILGYPGQTPEGADVVRLQFELLYGLTCEVTQSFLRLAELGSRLGRIQGRLPGSLSWPGSDIQQNAYLDFRRSWARRYARYLSRLAVLELWDSHQKPEEFLLQQNVNYHLRKTAALKYPIVEQHPRNPAIPDPVDGLPGGVAWGFESQNIYEAVWADPKSTSAKLARAYFSALGGWGAQKAGFDQNRSLIQSDTAQGRVFYYSVERLGRISCFWNRAKHVIVYERTVAPPRQFVDVADPKNDEEDRLIGRPVLRKVREYVEILQHVRHYPEDGGYPAIHRGCVLACEFPKDSIIIPVDSRWGSDTDEGWQVPLWRPDARPDVYPCPHVLLHLAADPDTAGAMPGGDPVLKQRMIEPHKLYFYTRTARNDQEKLAVLDDTQTDGWPSVRGVDFPNYPPPQPEKVPPFTDDSLDTQLPDAPAVPGGFGRFTFALEEIAQKANLVVERVQKQAGDANQNVLSAALRNVTMVRAAPTGKALPSELQVLSHVDDLTYAVDGLLSPILARLPAKGPLTDAVKKDVQKAIAVAVAAQGQADSVAALFKSVGDQVDKYDPCPALQKARKAAFDASRGRVLALFDDLIQSVKSAIQTAPWPPTREEVVKTVEHLVNEEVRRVAAAFSPVSAAVASTVSTLRGKIGDANAALDAYRRQIIATYDAVGTLDQQTAGAFLQRLDDLEDDALRLLRQVEAVASKDAGGGQPPNWTQALNDARGAVRQAVKEAREAIKSARFASQSEVKELRDKVQLILKKLRDIDPFAPLLALLAGLDARVGDLENALNQALAKIDGNKSDDGAADRPRGWLGDLEYSLREKLTHLPPTGVPSQQEIVAIVDQVAAPSRVAVANYFDDAEKKATDLVEELCRILREQTARVKQSLEQSLAGASQGLLKQLDDLVSAAGEELDPLRADLTGAVRDVRHALDPFADKVKEGLQSVLPAFPDFHVPDIGLRMLRAHGNAPDAQGLGFNRGMLGYFFDPAYPRIRITPVTALVGRAEEELERLKPLGLRIPTTELLDRLIPHDLPQLDLSKVFPDLAGLRLDKLFPGIKMPDGSGDAVKVTQGIDKQTLTAWLRATSQFDLKNPATLFSFGPVSVQLLQASFFAEALIEAGKGTPPRKKTDAAIHGSWEVQMGGQPLVTFQDTSLTFDENNQLHFNLSPAKIRMSGLIQFLADVIQSAGYSSNGFSVKPIMDGSLPRGVQALLDLPLPDLNFGAFGMSNLRLSASFELSALPRNGSTDFVVAASLGIARKDAPFNLNVWILAGGGWFEVRVVYAPFSGRISCALSLGISAGAKLALSLGPIKGEVEIFFSVGAEYAISSGGGASPGLTISLSLLIRGEVEIPVVASILIVLLLEVAYGGGRMVGRGSLKIRIKICWCFTFEFEASVEYHLDNVGLGAEAIAALAAEGPDAPENPYLKNAQNYLAIFEPVG